MAGLSGGVVSTGCDVAGCRYLAMHICEPHVRARSQEEHADLERQLEEAQQLRADWEPWMAALGRLELKYKITRFPDDVERAFEERAEAQQQRDAFWESRDAAEQRAEQAEAQRDALRILVEPFVREAHKAGYEDALITYRDIHLDDQPYVWVEDLLIALASLPAAQETK